MDSFGVPQGSCQALERARSPASSPKAHLQWKQQSQVLASPRCWSTTMGFLHPEVFGSDGQALF